MQITRKEFLGDAQSSTIHGLYPWSSHPVIRNRFVNSLRTWGSPCEFYPYTLSKIFRVSVGLTPTAFYIFCVLLQLFILKKEFKVRHLLKLVFDVFTVVLTDVVINAPDGLVKTISEHWNISYSRVKSTFDNLCMVTS